MRSWLTTLTCWLRCHDYRIVQELTPRARKLWCRRCDKYFAMNDEFQCVLDWDSDLEELYKLLLGVERTLR